MRRSELLEDEDRKRQEAIDYEMDIMGPQGGASPEEVRATAMRRLGISADPGQPLQVNDGTGGSGLEPAQPAPEPQPTPEPAPRQQPQSSLAVNGPDSGGINFPVPSLPKSDPDRVSQALYSAFTRRPLDPSFFSKPADMAMRQEELDQRKSHNDYMKDQLRAKYASKGVSTDPEDGNAGSPQSRLAQSAILGSKTMSPIVARMGGEEAIRSLSLRQIQSMFPAKSFSPLLSGEYREENKIPVETAKQGNRIALQDDKQAYDQDKTKYTTEHQDTRSANALAAAESHFQQAFHQKQDAMAYQVSQKIPKDAKMVFDAGARIDALVGKLGGPGKLDGIGLVEGVIPNALYSKDVIALRQEINNLVNGYTHQYFGANLSEHEKKRADAAVPMISGARTEAEILHGVQILRQALLSSTEQALGGASPAIKQRLFDYYSQGGGSADLFGQGDSPAASAQEPGTPPALAVTEQVSEPTPEQLQSVATSPTPVEIRRKPQAKAPAAAKGPISPKGLTYARTKFKDGKTYFIDKANKIIDWVEGQVDGK